MKTLILTIAILIQVINLNAQPNTLKFIEISDDVFGREISDSITLKITNTGDSNLKGFEVNTYFSKNANSVENSIYIGGTTIEKIEVGDTMEICYELTEPDMPRGTYFMVSSIEVGEMPLGEYYTEESVMITGNENILTGTHETKAKIAKIYPNPVIATMTVEFQEFCTGTISLYNSSGKNLDQFLVSGKSLKINLSQYPKGIYFLKNENYSHKILKL